MSDFAAYMRAKTVTAEKRARYDHAAAALELAIMKERCAEILSQHEPLNTLGIDRDAAAKLIQFIHRGHIA